MTSDEKKQFVKDYNSGRLKKTIDLDKLTDDELKALLKYKEARHRVDALTGAEIALLEAASKKTKWATNNREGNK